MRNGVSGQSGQTGGADPAPSLSFEEFEHHLVSQQRPEWNRVVPSVADQNREASAAYIRSHTSVPARPGGLLRPPAARRANPRDPAHQAQRIAA
jgi:hypothetical protein